MNLEILCESNLALGISGIPYRLLQESILKSKAMGSFPWIEKQDLLIYNRKSKNEREFTCYVSIM